MEQESDLFQVFQEAFGFIPNLLRAQSVLPRVIAAHAKLEEAVSFRDGAISRTHKERILLSIAADRRDLYWIELDAELLASIGVTKDHIVNLLNDYRHAGLLSADLALIEFCLKLSRDSLLVSLQDVEALRAKGLRDEAIVEAVVVTALSVYRGTLSAALRPEPDFKLRNLPLRAVRGTIEAAPATLVHSTPRIAGKKGSVRARSLLKPKYIHTFLRRSEESRIYSELFFGLRHCAPICSERS